MNSTAVVMVIGIAAAVALAVYVEIRRQRASRLAELRKRGFVCYHGYSVFDCAVCKAGVTKKELDRHTRRRADRHNSKVLKRMKKRGVNPWA